MRRNFTVPYRPNRRQNTSLAGWVNWMQKWNRFISTSDRSDFYRTNVFILKHSHCSKQLTSLCLNSKSQICQNWKWIHFILLSISISSVVFYLPSNYKVQEKRRSLNPWPIVWYRGILDKQCIVCDMYFCLISPPLSSMFGLVLEYQEDQTGTGVGPPSYTLYG